MEQNINNEIDLLYLYKKIKEILRGWVTNLFRMLDFVIKKWIIITCLIIIGLALGYYNQTNSKPLKKATSLIRINFNAVAYVYSEIENLNNKILENDINFFNENGFNSETLLVNELEISPIINFHDILEKYDTNDRKLEGLLKNLEFDEENLKIYETFTTEYKHHTLNYTLNNEADNESVYKIIDYLNNNILLNDLKESTKKNIEQQIINNLKSIKQIDNIIETYKSNKSLPSQNEQIYVVDKNFSIHTLFDRKLELQKLNEEFNEFLVYNKNIVMVVNKPNIVFEKKGILGNKIIIYPKS